MGPSVFELQRASAADAPPRFNLLGEVRAGLRARARLALGGIAVALGLAFGAKLLFGKSSYASEVSLLYTPLPIPEFLRPQPIPTALPAFFAA